MTNTLSRNGKFAVLASAVLYTALTFGVVTSTTPANAAGGAYYHATLAAPAGDANAVAGGVAWTCEGTTCVANKASARPLRICRGLNRKFGEIAAFKVAGEELPAEELAKCNA
ncbi:MAG: CC_3452 family protein [Erythrobacter sp.]